MLTPRCLALASKQRTCLVLAGRIYHNVCVARHLTLDRSNHVQRKKKVEDERDGKKSSAGKKSPKKRSTTGISKRDYELDSKASATPSPLDLKLSELQELARTLGVSQTAPKPALIARLQDCVRNHSPPPADARILSIDLGIRNLAYALLTPPRSPDAPKPTIHAWNRVDLRSLSALSIDQESLPPQDFSPAALSYLALNLVQIHLLPLNPTHILIEKQRFRSAGGSAVLEWTVRVNSLESMLYAIFATLKALGHFEGTVTPVDPRRVGPFLLENEGGVTEEAVGEGKRGKKGGRNNVGDELPRVKGSKENKKLKIALVGRWLREGRGVEFEGKSEVMRKAFLKRWLPKEKKNKSAKEAELPAEVEKGIGKLDDVADCLLQGVAWLRWEENKRKLVEGGAWQ
jgi:cruciform cutting endonuclease 1